MRGKSKIFLRSLDYLSKWKLPLKNSVNSITISYNTHGGISKGLREFVKYKLPQLQYNNPKVQMLKFKNRAPVPNITLFHDDGRKWTIDAEKTSMQELVMQLESVAKKDSKTLLLEEQARASQHNRANFGDARQGHFCMCEIPGQVSCPAKRLLSEKFRKKPWMQKGQ
ncbi:putative 28S ribosomal protein S25, mitochondrial [Trichoplax sp. H2]|uniref:Small ribosomal subunit protein mS25 n=1 Tax=Trichoplax adhaerens TaxID=10228 RepID=B3RUH1_TRIAD|nr:hypothetical protein TRIADDRAFT_24239 [Trichoplax adhaerens]EDV25331.1 hypothetical protein TRIADDRAFT_24239 [Trichoplax adhaerens]RDD46000.1 putative 28S ribosomal protein S25, mitochondrial [Trichoplax sp. H2]|eukprot:XP_002111364.1 hypothetical protein TRIADDRAFT_24239 [Trichoplax adhaerens]